MFVVTTKKKIKKVFIIVVLLLIVAFSFLYFYNVSFPFVLNVAEAEVKLLAITAINKAGLTIRAFEGFYGEYYKYNNNNDGEIVLVSANTHAINQMYLFAQKEVQKELDQIIDEPIRLPAGAFTGSSIIAHAGFPVRINLSTVGTAEASWHSYYFSEGINQTLHRVVLKINTKINILIPMKASAVNITTDLVIAENIIIGRVPDSYITGISDDNIFDLLP